MGCDIHGTVEVLTGSYGDLAWKARDISCHSLTYITWQELQPHLGTVHAIVQADEEYNKEWILLLDLIACLASRADNLRLIVWFDN